MLIFCIFFVHKRSHYTFSGAEMKHPMIRLLYIFLLFLNLTVGTSFARSLSAAHFTVEYDGVTERYARLVADSAERSILHISAAFGTAPDSTITIILASTDARFKELTSGTLPDWSAAVAVPGRKIILSPLAGQKINMEKILAHEIVHSVIEDNSKGLYVPRWFHEGCAELYSGEWGIRNEFYMTWKVTRGELMTFDDIQDVFSRGPMDAGLAYDQSMLAVRHLISLYGPKTLPRIIADMREGKTFPRAFLNATGYSPDDYQRDFARWMGETYGPRTFLTLIPGTWTIMMVLFLVVYLIKRVRSRRKLREWESQEPAGSVGPEPDDDAEEIILDEYDEEEEVDEPEEHRDNILPFKPRPKKYL